MKIMGFLSSGLLLLGLVALVHGVHEPSLSLLSLREYTSLKEFAGLPNVCGSCQWSIGELRVLKHNETRLSSKGQEYCKAIEDFYFGFEKAKHFCLKAKKNNVTELVKFIESNTADNVACLQLDFCEEADLKDDKKKDSKADENTEDNTEENDVEDEMKARAANTDLVADSYVKLRTALSNVLSHKYDASAEALARSKVKPIPETPYCSHEELVSPHYPSTEKCMEPDNMEAIAYETTYFGQPYEDMHLCWYGGDPASCSGHGQCSNYGHTGFQNESLMIGLTKKVDKSAKCVCHEGWEGKDCSKRIGMDYPTIAIVDEAPNPNASATLTWYCDLGVTDGGGEGCAGMCIGSMLDITTGGMWNLGAALPPGVRGVAAINPTLFGERRTGSDQSPLGNFVSHGKGCGKCFRLSAGERSRVIMVVDRCAGGCKKRKGKSECLGPNSEHPYDYNDQIECMHCFPQYPERGPINPLPSAINVESHGAFQPVDWCAQNDHPHFDVDKGTARFLCGLGQDTCTIDTWEEVQCGAVQANWHNGCDEDNWSNCPKEDELATWGVKFYDRDWNNEDGSKRACKCSPSKYKTNFTSEAGCVMDWAQDENMGCDASFAAVKTDLYARGPVDAGHRDDNNDDGEEEDDKITTEEKSHHSHHKSSHHSHHHHSLSHHSH